MRISAFGLHERVGWIPQASITAAIEAAIPVAKVTTGDEILFMQSIIASPELTDPPGELIMRLITSRFCASRIMSCWMIEQASSSSMVPVRKTMRPPSSSDAGEHHVVPDEVLFAMLMS